ncbi:hypothetical protein EIP86_010707 [Pleurotus ostreatoroseus]|nr:hypothetical protein EIP86_010707 [Pleurotus ostreatoroseus]
MRPHCPTNNLYTSSSARVSQEASQAASYVLFGIRVFIFIERPSQAKTVVAPLDRVKILFQASNPDYSKYAGTWSGAVRAGTQMCREGGALALFQGHSATLLRIFPYAAIKFMAYDQIENTNKFIHADSSQEPSQIVRVRMAYYTHSTSNGHPRPNFFSAASEILHEVPKTSTSSSVPSSFSRAPILKFYRGFSVSLVGMIPYAGTSFLTWGALRAHFALPPSYSEDFPSHPQSGRPLADLWMGAVAGTISQTVSYPFEVIRRRMQVGGLTHPDRWLRWSETVRAIWHAGGWRGFYVGLGIGYVKIIPMTACGNGQNERWEREGA